MKGAVDDHIWVDFGFWLICGFLEIVHVFKIQKKLKSKKLIIKKDKKLFIWIKFTIEPKFEDFIINFLN